MQLRTQEFRKLEGYGRQADAGNNSRESSRRWIEKEHEAMDNTATKTKRANIMRATGRISSSRSIAILSQIALPCRPLDPKTCVNTYSRQRPMAGTLSRKNCRDNYYDRHFCREPHAGAAGGSTLGPCRDLNPRLCLIETSKNQSPVGAWLFLHTKLYWLSTSHERTMAYIGARWRLWPPTLRK